MTRAAEELHLTQPSLTLSIRRLEAELGVPLFERKGKRIYLNEYGKILLEKSTTVFSAIQMAEKEINDLRQKNTKQMALMLPPALCTASLMGGLKERFPGLTFSSIDLLRESLRSKLLADEINFSITTPAISGGGIDTIPIMEERGVVLLSELHPLADYSKLRMRDLKNECFVSHLHGFPPRMRLERSCAHAGYSPHIIFEAASLRDLLQSIRENSAVAVVCLNVRHRCLT